MLQITDGRCTKSLLQDRPEAVVGMLGLEVHSDPPTPPAADTENLLSLIFE
jgi:hypothetical protein